MSEEELDSPIADAMDSLPGLARVAASSSARAALWGLGAYARTGKRVAQALVDREVAAGLRDDVIETATVVSGLARAVASGMPLAQAVGKVAAQLGSFASDERVPQPFALEPAETLRVQGARLLERSRDVMDEDSGHPAYARILGELAPDEARILLLLLEGGPQPSVDVRTGGPIGVVSSRLIAPGLTMIGARAGVRYLDQVPAYLNNLFRLGLVWFSHESLRDHLEYQVLEAQPDVLAAMHSTRFTKVVRRSIHLTPFGEDFCRTCLIDETQADEEFPEHAAPPETEAGEPPKTQDP